MSPDAVVGLLHLADRWALALAQLRAEKLPPLPEAQGRVHRLPDPTTPDEDAQQRDAELQAAVVWRALADDCEGGHA
jgi:hypothetical protein